RWRGFAHPAAGWAGGGGLVVWSACVGWAYDAPGRRRTWLLGLDVAVAVAALLSTPWVEGADVVARHAPTVPSFWVMVPVLAVAVARGWAGGLVAAVIVSVCDLSVRNGVTGPEWGNIFLLLLAAAMVGYAASLVHEAAEARARAERAEAALHERARLARVVHDGVLQVLAMVQRRGLELGGEVAELGRLAGEQEVRLRALVQGEAAGSVRRGTTLDLARELGALASRTVTVAVPGGEVPLPGDVAEELVAVVGACLDNVARHVGPEAPAWVLLEALGDRLVVSVRDEGDGIAAGRLEEARAQGRLGVSESIRGRMGDLGGSAALTTAPGAGVEWELTLPSARGPSRSAPASPGLRSATGSTRSSSRGRRR
ncbi:MAG: MacS family sensor histidine kinase, partial [Nocardioidaceae bacterium]